MPSKIALVYDFDETLTPKAMQEYTVLKKLGVNAADFWAEVAQTSKADKAEGMLVYMRLMIEKAQAAHVRLQKEDFADMAADIEYFPGVDSYWFDAINAYVINKSNGQIEVEHYIISAGNREILEGISIKDKFAAMYASEYYFDHNGVATFANRVVTDTSKTQYLFRINKGATDLNDSVNTHMPEAQRAIPFSNMIYFGDGDSDVPSMSVTKKEGGHAVAVYGAGNDRKQDKCQSLLEAGRIDFFAEANYTMGSKLEAKTRLILDKIISENLLKFALLS